MRFADCLRDRDEEGLQWAEPLGENWRAAWEGCPRVEWLLSACADLPLPLEAVVEGLIASAGGPFARLADEGEDPDVVARLHAAIAALDRWSRADGPLDEVFAAAHRVEERLYDCTPRAMSLASAVDALARGVAGDGALELAGVAMVTAHAGDPDDPELAGTVADRLRSAVPYEAVSRALRRLEVLDSTRAGRLVVRIARAVVSGDQVLAGSDDPMATLARSLDEAIANVPVADRMAMGVQRYLLSFGDDVERAWRRCPRADWQLAMLADLQVDPRLVAAAVIACLEPAVGGDDRSARHLEVARAYAAGGPSEPCVALAERLYDELEDPTDAQAAVHKLLQVIPIEGAVSLGMAGLAAQDAAHAIGGDAPHLVRRARWLCAERIRATLPASMIVPLLRTATTDVPARA